MKALLSLIGNTIKGGIFFLLPLILILVLLKKGVDLIMPLSHWLNEISPLELPFSAFFLSIVLLAIICLLAGWLGRKNVGMKGIHWIEENFLVLFPGYKLMKSSYETMLGVTHDKEFQVVLVPIDGWMIAFLVEELSETEVLVFVPSSPTPWEGNLVIFEKDKIKFTQMKSSDIITIMKRLGVGTRKIFAKN